MQQNNERPGEGAGREEQRKNKGESVLADKDRFEHAPHRGSNEPSHRVREMGQPERGGKGSEESKTRKP